MRVEVTPIEAYSDNYVWAIHDDAHAVVVDPGETAPVAAYLARHRLELGGILVTHHHHDHAAGVEGLVKDHAARGRHIPVYGFAGSKFPHITHPVRDESSFHIAAVPVQFSVMEVPGHTLDHVAYLAHATHAPEPAWLFCGDTLFSCGCGRVFEGTHEQMVRSLEKLQSLEAGTLIFPAHEYTLANLEFALEVDPQNNDLQTWASRAAKLRWRDLPTLPTSIALEKRVNPFLRLDQAPVEDWARRSFDLAAVDKLSIFTALRTAKNVFKHP